MYCNIHLLQVYNIINYCVISISNGPVNKADLTFCSYLVLKLYDVSRLKLINLTSIVNDYIVA